MGIRLPLALAVAVVVAAAGSQPFGTTAAAQAPQQPTFRSGTSIVEVTVVVRDADGAFVRGLTADDFAVVENGVPQPVETVYLVERPGAVPVAGDAPAVESGAPPQLPAAERRTFVFLFDMEHLTPGSLTRARDAVTTFARERLLPSDISGVAALGVAGGRISQDHQATAEAIASLTPRADKIARDRNLAQWPRILSPLEAMALARNDQQEMIRVRDRACLERQMECAAEGTAIDPSDLAAFEAEANTQTIENELRSKAATYVAESRVAAERSLAMLTQIATALEQIPGRKTLVWATEGAWSEEIAERARDAAIRAAQSGVVIYTIDPRGLGRSAGGDMNAVAGADVGQQFLQAFDDIPNVVAADSGGRAFRNENNLTRALAFVEDDASTYYIVGYTPTDTSERTNARRLDVRVTRDGLQARVRHAFMAPRRLTTRTAPEPEPAAASEATPPPEPEPAAASEATPPPEPEPEPEPEPRTEPREPAEPMEPVEPRSLSFRADAVSRVAELSSVASPDGRDRGKDGWEAYQRGDVETALPLLQHAAAAEGSPAWVHYALGFSYVGVGRPAEALNAWETVLRRAPDFAPVYLDLATTYSQVRNFERALAVLRQAATRWPDDPEVHNGIGVVLIRKGDENGALAAFDRAVAVDPANAISWLNLGRAYELRYMRNRRFIKTINAWIGPERDLDKARESYVRSASLGGHYGTLAEDALQRLAWSDKTAGKK